MVQSVNLSERQSADRDALDPQAQKSPSPTPSVLSQQTHSDPKRYARIKLTLSLIGTTFGFVFILALLLSGATTAIERFVRLYLTNDYLALLGFAALLGVAQTLLTLPLQYYSGFYLEHKYGLSNQSFGAWVWEGTKSLLVSIPIVTPLLLAFLYCLKTFGATWWLPVGAGLFFVSVILARLGPVLIFPLFYKFELLPDGGLKSTILRRCAEVGMPVQGVFVFNMSKNTKKANAAFTGLGKSRRIILGDTLVANFRDDEIETVFAHELGHYKLKHLLIMLSIGTVNSFLGLYVTALLYSGSLSWFGFSSIDQIAVLPLLALWLGLFSFITTPLVNMVSRAHERAADRFAVQLTKNGEAFANSLRKLASINLADVSPHPTVEFLFHSHPSIEKRIRAIELLTSASRPESA